MDKLRRNFNLTVEKGSQKLSDILKGIEIDPGSILIQPPFTMEFDVVRNVLSSANDSTFKVYNLAESTRKMIFKDRFDTDSYKSVELKAGYGQVTPTIFKGNIKQAWSVREGTNFVTTIEGYDGGFAYLLGEIDASFQKGISNSDKMAEIIKKLPKINLGAIGSFKDISQRGNTYSGNSTEVLKEISGGGFFIDNENAYVLGDNECIRGSLTDITSDNGLLGTPRREETLLTFDMIFEPRLLIGQLVNLRSNSGEYPNAQYKVVSLHHRGIISDSTCGTATTTVGLFYGSELLKVIN